MELFFTSDLHFCHANVMKYNNRPWKNIDEMNEALIERWNSKVGKKDTVIIVGDFAFDRHGYFINALRGKKELVLGNHDKMSQAYLRCFSNVCLTKEMIIKKRKFWFQHCCPRVWPECHYGAIAIHGHSHGRLKTYNLSFDVGVDVPENRYSPVNVEEIFERISIREAEMNKAGRIENKQIEKNGKTFEKKMFYQDDVAFFTRMMTSTGY